jgi:hypothetical protein
MFSILVYWDSVGGNYFEIMLPGRATLTVHSLPFVGVNTAVGFVVSISTCGVEEVLVEVPLEVALASASRFRFYATYLAFELHSWSKMQSYL